MSMLPNQAPSMRTCEIRLPPSSATAMFIGCPISFAFLSAAVIILRASSSLIIDLSCLSIRDAGKYQLALHKPYVGLARAVRLDLGVLVPLFWTTLFVTTGNNRLPLKANPY